MVMAIFSMISIGIAGFLRYTGHSLFTSAEKLEINNDIRMLTQQMIQDARAANTFKIYKSANLADRNSDSDERVDGQSGDFLLLVYQEHYPTFADTVKVRRLVGYFRSPEGTGLPF